MLDPYDLVLIVLGVLLVLIALALVWRRMRERVPAAPPYVVKEEILTRDERALLPLVEQAFGDEFRILFRVRLEDLVEPTAASGKKRRRALEVLEGRTIPFLICRADDFAPVAAILPGEEGTSPLPELSACGIAVLQFPATPLPRPHEIRSKFERRLNDGKEAVQVAGVDKPTEQEDDWLIGSQFPPSEDEGGWLEGISSSRSAEPEEKAPSRGEANAHLLCPECGTAMTRRRMIRGPHAGRELWVCANFPTCRKTVPVLHD